MKKNTFLILILSLMATLRAEDAQQRLLAIGVANEGGVSIIIINTGIKSIEIKSVACLCNISKASDGTNNAQSENLWFEHAFILKPNDATCVAVVPIGSDKIELKIEIDEQIRNIPIANIDSSKAWLNLQQKKSPPEPKPKIRDR